MFASLLLRGSQRADERLEARIAAQAVPVGLQKQVAVLRPEWMRGQVAQERHRLLSFAHQGQHRRELQGEPGAVVGGRTANARLPSASASSWRPR